MSGQPLPAKFPLLHTNGREEASTPQDTVRHDRPPILQVRDLVTRFDIRGGLLNRVKRRVHAVEKVSFDLYAGETLALWASPAAVNPPPDARCCGWSPAGRQHHL